MDRFFFRPAIRHCLLFAVVFLTYSSVIGKKTYNPDSSFTLPTLDSIKSPLQYIKLLGNFETIDFQPVRDISFFFDLWIFRNTGLVSFSTINIFLWAFSCWLILRLLERIVPDERRKGLVLWVMCFAVFPLFSQSVSWGMARKHILAFPLFLLATNYYLDWLEGKKEWLKSYLFYVASSLSQPLVIFWPVWALTHYFVKKQPKHDAKKIFTIFFITLITLLLTNYAYYTVGNQVVSDIFGKSSPHFTNVSGMLLNLNFYARQMIYPYSLGFLYMPRWELAWPGLLLVAGVMTFLWVYRKDREVFSWLIFILIPVPVFLPITGSVFDQYLIIPTCGVLILAARAWNRDSRILWSVLTTLVIGWSLFTHQQVSLWQDPVALNKRNFENSPSCKSALFYAHESYISQMKASPELMKYLRLKNCFATAVVHAPVSRNWVFSIEASMLFMEEELFTLEQRLGRLEELGRYHYYPRLLQVTLLSKLNQAAEVERISAEILSRVGDNPLELTLIIGSELRPYCQSKGLSSCLKITTPKSVPGYL